MTNVLLYGYGNPGRQDDGLGNAFIDRIEEWIKEEGLENIELDSNYQLNIEDAEAISNYDIAIFIDASVEEIDDFCVTKVSKESERILIDEYKLPEDECSAIAEAIENGSARAISDGSCFDDEKKGSSAFIITPD